MTSAMFIIRSLSTFLLLAEQSLASPFYRGFGGPRYPNKLVSGEAPTSAPAIVARYVVPSGAYVSNGIEYTTKTVIITVTEGAPSPAVISTHTAAPPATSAPAVSAPAAAPPPAASSPAAPPAVPSMQHATMATSVAPAPTSKAATSPAASPTAQAQAAAPSPVAASGSGLTADQILKIMPLRSSCPAPASGQNCRTAQQAVAPLAAGFAKWGITSKGAQAANLALIAYESAQLLYDTKQFPVTPGQGTRNMMSPSFVKQYATQLYPDKIAAANGDVNAIIALVLNDNDSFGSASWFLKTNCPNVLKQFDTDVAGAWTAYLGSGCIGTTDNSGRDDYFTAAKAALGV